MTELIPSKKPKRIINGTFLAIRVAEDHICLVPPVADFILSEISVGKISLHRKSIKLKSPSAGINIGSPVPLNPIQIVLWFNLLF